MGLYIDRMMRIDRANELRYVLINPEWSVVEVLVAIS